MIGHIQPLATVIFLKWMIGQLLRINLSCISLLRKGCSVFIILLVEILKVLNGFVLVHGLLTSILSWVTVVLEFERTSATAVS